MSPLIASMATCCRSASGISGACAWPDPAMAGPSGSNRAAWRSRPVSRFGGEAIAAPGSGPIGPCAPVLAADTLCSQGIARGGVLLLRSPAPPARRGASDCAYTSAQRGTDAGLTGVRTRGRTVLNCSAPLLELRLGGASFRRYPLPDRARRSLKTQQHARLSTQSGRRCASRFDPSVPFTGREGLKKNPVIPRYETCIARAI